MPPSELDMPQECIENTQQPSSEGGVLLPGHMTTIQTIQRLKQELAEEGQIAPALEDAADDGGACYGPPVPEADITEKDVLCGRDKISHSHIGNKHFLSIIKEHRETYQTATSRESKTRLSTEIVGMIRALGGRFLKCDPANGDWSDVGDAVAREKVSHALRSCKDPNRPRIKRPRVIKKYVPSQRENALFERSVAFLNIFFEKLCRNNEGAMKSVGDPTILREALEEFRNSIAGKGCFDSSSRYVSGPSSNVPQHDGGESYVDQHRASIPTSGDADKDLAAIILASLASQIRSPEPPIAAARELPPTTSSAAHPQSTAEVTTNEHHPEEASDGSGVMYTSNLTLGMPGFADKTVTEADGQKIVVNNNDCLCGRGGLANKHPGNVLFRRLVSHNKDLYQSCDNKSHKQLLTLSIVETIDQVGGRFLRRDDDTGEWIEISKKEAISKTAQALREQEGKNRKGIGQDNQD